MNHRLLQDVSFRLFLFSVDKDRETPPSSGG